MTESNSGRAKPRRRRSRRHRRGADLGDSTPTSARAESIAAATPVGKNHSRPSRRSSPHLPTVHEFSAGGLVVDGLDRAKQVALLIGRSDRRGGMVWTLPKGHIEVSERAEQTAIREIAEETGVRARSSRRWAASTFGSGQNTTWCTRRRTIICCGSSMVSRPPTTTRLGKLPGCRSTSWHHG